MNTYKNTNSGFQRDHRIDLLKSISIILIIITHDPFFIENYHIPIRIYVIDMAVPVFMLISGMNYGASFARHSCDLKHAYAPKLIIYRLLRFLIPYTLVFLTISTLQILIKNAKYSIGTLFLDYIKGGYGPGSYYTPIMVQFVLVSPLLFHYINKYRIKAITSAFIINLLFEVALTCGMPWVDYPRTIIRYLFIISVGMYMTLYKNFCENNAISYQSSKIKLLFICSFILGVIYLTYTQFISEPIIFTRWTTTSMITAFYVTPIIELIEHLPYFDSQHEVEKNTKKVAIISSATYHIYLTQMTYYYIG